MIPVLLEIGRALAQPGARLGGVMTHAGAYELDQPEALAWAILDAGWMAMSRGRGTQKQRHDCGYGQACTLDGTPLQGYVTSGANQEHGILSREGAPDRDIVQRFPGYAPAHPAQSCVRHRRAVSRVPSRAGGWRHRHLAALPWMVTGRCRNA